MQGKQCFHNVHLGEIFQRSSLHVMFSVENKNKCDC